ncbi:MAG: glycine zipper 2TM domain-containing protein [Steroidobacteraceae bacterium]
MNKSMAIGLGLGIAAAIAGGTFASYKIVTEGGAGNAVAGAKTGFFSRDPRYAAVLAVTPVTKTLKVARQDCHDEQVTRVRDTKDAHQIAGSVVGAVVGGVLGNQVGGGSGKAIATVAGAAGGGYAGNRIEKRMQQGNTYTTTEQRCVTVYDSKQKSLGYDVRYRLDGKVATVRMHHDPGPRIAVVNGELVLESKAITAPQT